MTDSNPFSSSLASSSLFPKALGALTLALLALLVYGPLFEPSSWHVHGPFVDQAGYVTTARRWLDEGQLSSGILYPAYVGQDHWRPYMPGHYACLALGYRLLGYGLAASLLPSLGAFLVSTVGTFWLVARRYGPGPALGAAMAFALFPGNLVYAFTAMAESTFTAAGVVALCALLFVPQAWRAAALPFLLVLPFLFRETGALLVLPMLAVAAQPRPRFRIFSAFLASVLVLLFVNWIQALDGKGSVPMTWASHGQFNYNDAVADYGLGRSPVRWAQAVGKNTLRNLETTRTLVMESPMAFRTTGYAALLLVVAANLVLGWRLRRRDPLPFVCGGLGLTVLVLAYTLYDVGAQKGLRNLLFTLPVGLVGLAGLAMERSWLPRPRAALVVGLAVLLPVQWLWTRSAARELVEEDERIEAARAAMETVEVPPDKLALVPFRLIGDYTVQVYPTRTAFSPANGETFDRLEQTHGVGAWFVPREKLPEPPPRQLHQGLLRLHRRLSIHDEEYLVYRRAQD